MRILYLSQTYVPSERAGSVQTMNMCAALAGLGHEVTLVAKNGDPASAGSPGPAIWEHYDVPEAFELELLERPRVAGGSVVHAWRLRRKVRELAGGVDLAFSRDLVGAWCAARAGLRTVFEVHEPPSNRLERALFASLVKSPNLRRVVSVSESGARRISAKFGLEALVAPNGARLPDAPPAPPRPSAEMETVTVGFVGRFHRGKGAEMVVPLARRLPELEFRVAGGGRSELERLAAEPAPSNVLCVGALAPSEVSAFLSGVDVALLPNQDVVFGASGRGNLAPWTSPLKMFEYLAHGKAIVASDLAVLREVLRHGHNALLVPASDADAWAAAVSRLAADAGLRRRLGRAARRAAQTRYTWEARARRVLEGL